MGFIIITFLSVHALANVLTGAEGQAVGNWGAAVTHDRELGALNPASIIFTRGYHLKMTRSESGSHRLGILDNMPDTVVPTSFLYGEDRDSQGELSQRTFMVNIARALGRHIAFGLGAGYEINPGFGNEQNSLRGRMGVIHYLQDNLAWGVTTNAEVINIGFNYIFREVIRLRGDSFKQAGNSTMGWSLGVETFMNQWFVLKAGYRWQDQRHLSSWGMSFVGPRLHLNYAHAPDLMKERGGFVHWLDLSLPLW